MSIQANFYKNNKRVNSTKIPAMSTGDFAVTVELKEVTNLFTPTLIITRDVFHDSQDNLINPMEYNYVYLPDFSRYYFVRSWSWILGRWECDLEVDVLASFKTQIGNTTAYVLRSASAADTRLIDTKYPTKGDMKASSVTYGTMWETDLSSSNVANGFFVLGIVNNDTGAIGATAYYAVNAAGMRKFMAELYASPSWMNITDASISTDLQKMLMNPIQYIVSCQWIPYQLLNASSLTQIYTIPVGWWSVTINSNDPFYKLTGSSLKMSFAKVFDIPVHPQATGNFLWLKNSPYSNYQIQFYPFGVFPIDAAKLIGYDKIYCNVELDLVTGIGTLTATRGIGNTSYEGHVLFAANAQVGIPISMAQMSVDMSRLTNGTTWGLSAGLALASDTAATSELAGAALDVVNSVTPDVPKSQTGVNTLLGLAAAGQAGNLSGMELARWRNAPGGMNVGQTLKEIAPSKDKVETSLKSLLASAGKVAANIGNAVLASSGTCHTVGSTGALAQYTLKQIITLYYFEIVDTDPTRYGYPLSQLKKINTLSGFVLCANEGDLSVPATAIERNMIISAMKAGFYYE